MMCPQTGQNVCFWH